MKASRSGGAFCYGDEENLTTISDFFLTHIAFVGSDHMAKSANQKLKILFLLQYLEKKTDETHPASTKELIDYLAQQGISAERKTIYADIEALIQFGYDIEYIKARRDGGYYMASRKFELPELKLLVDLVQSSKFITTKKSREFIKKLETLASEQDAGQLQRQVFVANRVKTDNESIYYLVDEIHRAIGMHNMISFQYVEMTVDKKERFKRGGKRYKISPWALTWNDECYYLIGYDHEVNAIKHYRVDKMHAIETEKEKRLGAEAFEAFDLAAYCKKAFHMYAGPEESILLEFEDYYSGVVFDRFGRDIQLHKKENNTFTIHVNVMISNQFFGWLAGLGNGVKIISPKAVRDQYRDYMNEIIKGYEKEI